MGVSEAQKRATAKWSANPENAHMLRRANGKYRRKKLGKVFGAATEK